MRVPVATHHPSSPLPPSPHIPSPDNAAGHPRFRAPRRCSSPRGCSRSRARAPLLLAAARLFLKTHRANARAEDVERQLQQLFHLDEAGAGPGLDQAAIDALPAFAYTEPSDIEEQIKLEDASPKQAVASSVVLPVRLGRFTSVQGSTTADGQTGTSCRLDGRRCFSMASSYRYVLPDDKLVVSVRWRPGDSAAAMMHPDVTTTASSDQQGKRVCAASRGDSFSVSKIWKWRRSGRRLPGLRVGKFLR